MAAKSYCLLHLLIGQKGDRGDLCSLFRRCLLYIAVQSLFPEYAPLKYPLTGLPVEFQVPALSLVREQFPSTSFTPLTGVGLTRLHGITGTCLVLGPHTET